MLSHSCMTFETTRTPRCNAALVICVAGLVACKSDADKCRDENNELYRKTVSACKDEACKKAAADELKKYLAACDGMK